MITRNGGCRSPISICPISTRHQHCQNYGWDRTMNSWTWMLQRGMELFSTRYKQVSLIHLIYVSFHFNISLLLYYLIILHEISQSLLIIFYHFLFRSILRFLIFFVISRNFNFFLPQVIIAWITTRRTGNCWTITWTRTITPSWAP